MSVAPVSACPDQAKATRLPSGDNAGAPFHTWVRSQREQLGWSAHRRRECAPYERAGDNRSDEHQSADGDPCAPEVGDRRRDDDRRRLLNLRGNNWRSGVGGRDGIRFEDRYVAALRQRDDDGIGSSLVVLAQFVAKAPGVHPDDGIGTAVEVRSLSVQLVGENRFFERMALPGQSLFDDEREEAPQLLGSGEDLAREDSLELSADDGVRQFASLLGAGVGFRGHRALCANGPGSRDNGPFPEVEHRRDLAPLTRRASEFVDRRGGSMARTRHVSLPRCASRSLSRSAVAAACSSHRRLVRMSLASELDGKKLFDKETFGGNGRTCLTCHSKQTGTLSVRDVQRIIKKGDPNNAFLTFDALDDDGGTTRVQGTQRSASPSHCHRGSRWPMTQARHTSPSFAAFHRPGTRQRSTRF